MSENFDKQLQQQSAQLQKDRAPDRDLWPGIEMALVMNKRRQVFLPAIAATVVACASGWMVWNNIHQIDNNQGGKIIAEMDAMHRQEMEQLKVTFQNTRALTTNWNEQLLDMERAADAIKLALKNDPQNITLMKMLSDVYQREANLLRAVHAPTLQNPDLI